MTGVGGGRRKAQACRYLERSRESCYPLVTNFYVNFHGMSSGRRWRNKRFEKGRRVM